jgi:putative ABC transport system permease protein
MIIMQHLRGAIMAIWQAKLRSFLTIIGIVIGVSSVVTVIAVGDGLRAQIKKEVDVLGVKVLTISTKPQAENFTKKDVASIQQLSGVEAAVPIMYVGGSTTAGNSSYDSLVTATSADVQKVVNQPLTLGRAMNPKESHVALIGSAVATGLFGTASPINQSVTVTYKTYDQLGQEKIQKTNFKVVGVFKKLSENSSIGLGSQLDGAIFIPLDDGTAINGNRLELTSMLVKAKDANELSTVSGQITNVVKANHAGKQGFTITTAEDVAKSYTQTLNQLTSFIAAVAAISLLVGGIGIMNIMLSSVTERTREIGIRKAIGAKQRTILAQFLVEALLLTMLGGLLGIACSFGLGYLAGLEIKISPQYTLRAYLIGVSISFFIGLVFGVVPALRAARKKPIEALRHD